MHIILDAIGAWASNRAPSEIFLAAFIIGSVLSWLAAREWYTAPDEDEPEGEGAHAGR